MDSGGISKKEYLKKYLSGGEKKKKKKKKPTQSLIIKSKIVDDDIDLKNMKPLNDDELEIFDLAEEAPQIAGIIDDRPEEIRIMSEYRSTKKWKIVTDEYGIEDVKITAIDRRQSDDGSPKREQEISIEIRKNSDVMKHSDSPGRWKPENISQAVVKVEMDSDASPPRRKKDEPSGRTIKKEKDASPPRRRRKEVDSDASPPRRRGKEVDSDASPPRRRGKEVDSNASPPRRRGKEVDSDASPPRRRRKEVDSDASPPRRRRKEVDSDASPPRKSRAKDSGSDLSPSRKASKKKRDLPPLRKRQPEVDSDESPPGRRERNSDRRRNESKRIGTKSKSPTESSQKSSDKDKNYGLKLSKNDDEDSKRSKKSSQQLGKTLSGMKAGLQSAEEMRQEGEKLRQKEKEMFERMPAEMSGRHAEAIVRNRKTGRRRDPVEEARKKREKEEKEAEKIAQYAVWGKGLKQVQDRQDQMKDELYEMSKPLARYKDDKDLDEMLRNQEREGDPMLEYIRRKNKGKTESSKPEYKGVYLQNRYDIKPGHKWDGVDRSNGYEKRWFEEQNARKAREEEAFKWSTEDM